jgi:hypothetical protein
MPRQPSGADRDSPFVSRASSALAEATSEAGPVAPAATAQPVVRCGGPRAPTDAPAPGPMAPAAAADRISLTQHLQQG